MKRPQVVLVEANLRDFTGVYNGHRQESMLVKKTVAYVYTAEEIEKEREAAVTNYLKSIARLGYRVTILR